MGEGQPLPAANPIVGEEDTENRTDLDETGQRTIQNSEGNAPLAELPKPNRPELGGTEERGHAGEEHKDKQWWWQKAGIIAVIVTAIVYTGLFWIGWRQTDLTTAANNVAAKAAAAAERAATAAEAAIEKSEDSTHKQARAYLFASGNPRKAELVEVRKGIAKWIIYLNIKNAGVTPAYQMLFQYVSSLAVPDDGPTKGITDNSFDHLDSNMGMALGPNGETEITMASPTLNDDDVKRLNDGQKVLWLVFTIRYQDVFGKPQWMHYHLKVSSDGKEFPKYFLFTVAQSS